MRDEMSLHELKLLLDQVPDTRELILRREASRGPDWNALYDAWSDAHEEAEARVAHLAVRWRPRGLHRLPRGGRPRGRRAGRGG